MDLRRLQNIDCTQKKVLMRVDFNVDLSALEEPSESFRLTAVQESVKYVLGHPGATLTLITHFGRPEGKRDERYSVAPLVPIAEKLFQEKILFTSDCLGKDDFSKSRVVLRENLRFYPEEEAGSSEFAEKLAVGFDLYVNEAFSVCHRNHASVVAITECLPSVAGIHLQREVGELEAALRNPAHPAVAILGGAKIETKLPLIHIFQKSYDSVLLGGMIANEAIDKQMSLGENVFLPTDFRGSERFDIGDQTIEKFKGVIHEAKTIVWNGPLGKFEESPFDRGTKAIVQALADSKAHTIVGGGESLTALQQANVFSAMDVVSTGGGAMLALLAGEPMPALTALTKK